MAKGYHAVFMLYRWRFFSPFLISNVETCNNEKYKVYTAYICRVLCTYIYCHSDVSILYYVQQPTEITKKKTFLSFRYIPQNHEKLSFFFIYLSDNVHDIFPHFLYSRYCHFHKTKRKY